MLAGVNAPVFGNNAIDAAGEKVAFVFAAPRTGTLHKVRFRIGAAATPEDVKVSFQDLDASGDPDGTPDQYRVVASASVAVGFVATGILSSDGTDTGTKRSVTRGDILAVVIEFNSATGNIQVSTHSSVLSAVSTAYMDHFTASWAKSATAAPLMSIEYSDGATYPIDGAMPGSFANETFNSSSTPDERGNTFTLPFAARVVGMWAWLDYDNAADLVLYSGTSALATAAVPAAAVRPQNTAGLVTRYFGTAQEVEATTYRAIVKPGASNVGLSTCTLADAVERAAFWRSDFFSTTRTDAGSFTDLSTKVFQVGPIIDAVDTSTGSGGGLKSLRRGVSLRRLA
jgi:hypothetical protein